MDKLSLSLFFKEKQENQEKQNTSQFSKPFLGSFSIKKKRKTSQITIRLSNFLCVFLYFLNILN